MDKNNLKNELNILDNDSLYLLLNDLFSYAQDRIYDFAEILEVIEVEDYIEENNED